MENIIKLIDINELYPHPNNPRKELGDLTELSDSIVKNGIMQNLTVIPGHYEQNNLVDGGYTIIIGHRRHAAAKAAGLTELPCSIAEMSEREQIGIMLEENMQRNDLTIIEQSQGFQMLLDLGETEESIAKKTGFSKSTIRHRINITKLDSELLKKKQSMFQLSLTDLAALEKIQDIEKRNQVLKDANSSSNLLWLASNAVKQEKEDSNFNELAKILEAEGVKKAPKKISDTAVYSSDWQRLKIISLAEDLPKKITWQKVDRPMYYFRYYGSAYIVCEAQKEKRQLTAREIAEKEQEKNMRKINAILGKATEARTNFLRWIDDNVKAPAYQEHDIWETLCKHGERLYPAAVYQYITSKSKYELSAEELEDANRKLHKMSLYKLSLIMYAENIKYLRICKYDGSYDKEDADKIKYIDDLLEMEGFIPTEDEGEEYYKIIDGTSDLFRKVEQNADND